MNIKRLGCLARNHRVLAKGRAATFCLLPSPEEKSLLESWRQNGHIPVAAGWQGSTVTRPVCTKPRWT